MTSRHEVTPKRPHATPDTSGDDKPEISPIGYQQRSANRGYYKEDQQQIPHSTGRVDRKRSPQRFEVVPCHAAGVLNDCRKRLVRDASQPRTIPLRSMGPSQRDAMTERRVFAAMLVYTSMSGIPVL